MKILLKSCVNRYSDFSYGHGSAVLIAAGYKDKQIVEAERHNINYYKLTDGLLVHIYHATEV